jgi:predicted methyltransferase
MAKVIVARRLAAYAAACFLVLGLGTAVLAVDSPGPASPLCIKTTSKASLIHLGSLDSFDITEAGKQAARSLIEYFDTGRREAVQSAIEIYQVIIPKENFGGEYTALNWIAECLLADGEKKKEMLSDRYAAEFFKFLSEDNFARLKDFLQRKYHLKENEEEETPEAKREKRFLEDFILFSNPHRENWEKSSKIIEALGLKEGQKVADVGCGPGYFSFKFADLVGPKGLVYAIDVNDQHIDYMSRYAQKYGFENVRPMHVRAEDCDIGLKDKVDLLFMCSLYHIIYATMNQEEFDRYMGSIRDALADGGRLVVVDNGLVDDATLPYHGPYIHKELIIRQLHYYGFRLVADHQFIPQRYALIFEKTALPDPAESSNVGHVPPEYVPVTSGASLVYVLIGGRDTGFTEGGRTAAKVFFHALETKDPDILRLAIQTYDKLIPKERFGDEYTAFQWFCRYLLGSESQRKGMLAEGRHTADYFELAAADDYALLKKYVKNKYFLSVENEHEIRKLEEKAKGRRPPMVPQSSDATAEEVITWGEIFTYANPIREQWEKTSKILDFLKVKPGEVIGDVGCGAGYYTFKFSDLVGQQGKVFAVDTNKMVLDFLAKSAEKQYLPVVPVLSTENNTKLPPNSCDMVFICTMYHAVYVTSIEYVKDEFINSIKMALRPGGRFVIVDNTILPSNQNPFYGPRIAKELIISQLQHYGFKLVDSEQIIPQRYVLVFQLDEDRKPEAS